MANEEFLTFSNLMRGLNKSCRNVRWKTSVTQYELNGLKNTTKLLRDCANDKYTISKYQIFEIYEPKHRVITATRIRDRQFQRCMCDEYLYEELTRSFIYDNCACQKNKGTHFAMNRLKAHLQKYYRSHGNTGGYYLKCDISHFFDSINHDVAKAVVRKRVRNTEVVKYVDDIIDSFGGECGIGLGSQVSQLIALAVLDDMDHMIKERLGIRHYIRYMDDFVLIHEDIDYLRKCLNEISDHLQSICLSLNSKTTIQPLKNGIKFLNWRYILKDSGKVLMIPDHKRIGKKRKKVRKMKQMCCDGRIAPESFVQTVDGIIAHLEHGSSEKAVGSIIEAAGVQDNQNGEACPQHIYKCYDYEKG